jgi:hypothetical protein
VLIGLVRQDEMRKSTQHHRSGIRVPGWQDHPAYRSIQLASLGAAGIGARGFPPGLDAFFPEKTTGADEWYVEQI